MLIIIYPVYFMDVRLKHHYLIFQNGIKLIQIIWKLFCEYSSLTSSPDLSNWNLSNVNDISDLFYL